MPSKKSCVYLCAHKHIIRASPDCFRNNYKEIRRADFLSGSICDSVYDLEWIFSFTLSLFPDMLEETVVLGDLWSSPQASEFMNGDI